jgi:uncharacterized protein (TIRG00374 family)
MCVALALLLGLFAFVSPGALISEFLTIKWEFIALLLLISAALVWISAAKWRLFLPPDAPPTLRLFRLYLVGYFVNALLPSYVGGDAARSYMVGRLVRSDSTNTSAQITAASATILERYTGLVAMFALGVSATLLPSSILSLGFELSLAVRLAVWALALGLFSATVCVLNKRTFAVLERVLPSRAKGIAARLRAGLVAGLSNKRALAEALLLSFVYHCFTVLNTAVAAYAVGWSEVSLLQLFIVLPLILTIGGLPLTPSGLGLQEGAFVYFLTMIGGASTEALAIGILLRAKTYLLAIIGWVLLFFEDRSALQPGADESVVKSVVQVGTGRAALVVISDSTESIPFSAQLLEQYRIVSLELAGNFSRAIWRSVDTVEGKLAEAGVRSGLCVGIGGGAIVVQALALRAPKLVRQMVLIDAVSRPHPTLWIRVLDRIERYLPLGLPFRNLTDGFDALSLAHRLRSPCVVAVSSQAGAYERSEALVLAERLPTAVLLQSGVRADSRSGPQLSRAECIFEAAAICASLPAKRPQKTGS